MKAQFERIRQDLARSFHIHEQRIPRFDAPWHFHPEVELTLIVSSEGRRFVGDSIESFGAGDLVMLGPNLPHFWLNDDLGSEAQPAHSLVLQFREDFMGEGLWQRPELTAVRSLLARAARGLSFPNESSHEAEKRMRQLLGAKGVEAICTLFSLLDWLNQVEGARPLASASYDAKPHGKSEERLARVYGLIAEAYAEPLTLAQIASRAGMAPAAFSRFFKSRTGQNVFDYLADTRLERACRLLRESRHTVARIAGDCGFQSLSNFNRRFREKHECSPSAYRKAFLTAAERTVCAT